MLCQREPGVVCGIGQLVVSLYQYPEVYAALRAPDEDLLPKVQRAIARLMPGVLHAERTCHARHDGRFRSVMDPACGPGNWLEPFVEDWFIAGNDLEPAMIEAADRVLAAAPRELVVGDMRDLRFESGPFDLALEIAGTASIWTDPKDLRDHFRSVASHLVPGGLFLVTLIYETETTRRRDEITMPMVTHEAGPVATRPEHRAASDRSSRTRVGMAGEAWVRYEIVGFNEESRAERIRRTVRTRGVPRCPETIQEEYEMRFWTPQEVQNLVDSCPELDLVDGDALGDAETDPLGERVLALRRI